MLTTKVINDGSGQVRIVEHDDRGEPEGISTPVVGDFRGMSAYQELISIPLARDQFLGKGSARLGLFLFTANVSPPATVAGADYIQLDCLVYGYLASAPTVIKRMSFSSGATDDFLRLDDSDNYDRIGVAGRQIVNGRPDSTTVLSVLSLSVTGRISR